MGPGPVWTGGKSRPHRDSIPNHPAHSQSLYRLSYPAHKIKSTATKSKEGTTAIEDEEVADRWQQYVEELCNDSQELEEWESEEEITPKELGPPITKSEFEITLKEFK